MGNIATGTALGFKYIKLSSNIPANVSDSDILFIEDTHQIRVNGVYFSISSTAFSGVQSELAGAQSKIATLEHNVGTTESLSKALLVIVNELKGKLDGGSYTGEQGAQSGTAIAEGLETSNTVAAINKLYDLVKNVQSSAGVQSVNTLTGVVTLDGTNVKTTSGAGAMFGQQTLDTAFKGVQSNIDGIQARINGEIEAREDGIQGVQGQINSVVSGIQSQLTTSISGVQSQFNDKIGISGTQSVKDYVDSVASSTLSGAQSSAKAYIDALYGENWTDDAKKIKDIIAEIEGSEQTDAWATLLDKLDGFGDTGVKDYIDNAIDTATGAAQGYANAAETSAKAYTDTAIQGLDATETGTSIDGRVKVTVVEENGVITGVQVVTDNIASATALQATQSGLTSVENQLKWQVIE